MEHDGYKYRNNGTKNGIIYFKCQKARSHFCQGSIKQLVDGTIVVVKGHSGHERDMNNTLLVDNFRNILKHRASTENTVLKNVYDDEARRNMEAAALYPWSSAESLMRLARRRALPRLPENLMRLATLFEEGLLPRFNCCDASLFKSCIQDIDHKYSIIFACNNLIQTVLNNNIQEIHADATFKVVPANMGYQMLTLHCMIQNYSIPIVYVLMERKSRNSYESVFRFVKQNLVPTLSPDIIVTDFETALRDVLQSTFPGARTVGCWFHHNQAVWKKMRNLNYLPHINNDIHASKALRLLLCLPLLPPQRIETGFILIEAFARHHNVHLERLFEYYKRYWLRSVGTAIVSVHGLPRRTNNNLESFHNSLLLKFVVHHPSLWIFLGHLVDLNKNYHVIVNQLRNNLMPTRHLRVKFLTNSRRIKNATEQFDLGLISMWQFLERCSYCSAAYEQRQRNLALRFNEDIEDDDDGMHDEEPLPLINDPVENGPEETDQLGVPVLPEEADQPEVPVLPEDVEQPRLSVVPEVATSSTCTVCLIATAQNSTAQYVILPCGHAWVCEECFVQLERLGPLCPVCRCTPVTFHRIFLS